MKFSICLPVFDRPAMLANALRTVARQTHDDLEVVVKDGCLARPVAQDKEVEDVFRLLAPRVRYVLSQDKGIFPALNEALSHATGDVLYFMCSDDELGDEHTLEAVDAVLRGITGPAWVYGQIECIDEHGIVQEVSGSRVEFADLLEDNFIVQPAVFWNRPMFQSVGYFNEKYAHSADYDYWLRCWKVSPGIYMPRILGRFRRWSGSHTSSNAKNQLRDTHLISLEHTKTASQNAAQRFMADEVRWRLRLLRLTRMQTWWAFLKFTLPIRHRLGLRRKRTDSVLNKTKPIARQ
jgi:glycosyltransferase involved in cell wall biosynthesis